MKRSGTVTFLFTDIEGSTQPVARPDGAPYLRGDERRRRLCRPRRASRIAHLRRGPWRAGPALAHDACAGRGKRGVRGARPAFSVATTLPRARAWSGALKARTRCAIAGSSSARALACCRCWSRWESSRRWSRWRAKRLPMPSVRAMCDARTSRLPRRLRIDARRSRDSGGSLSAGARACDRARRPIRDGDRDPGRGDGRGRLVESLARARPRRSGRRRVRPPGDRSVGHQILECAAGSHFASARGGLGATSAEAAWKAGRQMGFERAVDEARQSH